MQSVSVQAKIPVSTCMLFANTTKFSLYRNLHRMEFQVFTYNFHFLFIYFYYFHYCINGILNCFLKILLNIEKLPTAHIL